MPAHSFIQDAEDFAKFYLALCQTISKNDNANRPARSLEMLIENLEGQTAQLKQNLEILPLRDPRQMQIPGLAEAIEAAEKKHFEKTQSNEKQTS